MDESSRIATRRLSALLGEVAARPESFGFVQLLRAVERGTPELPPIGTAPHPRLEALRLGQAPHLAFKASDVAGIRTGPSGLNGDTKPWLRVWFMGLLGPFGPLPEHLNALAYTRDRNHRDPTLGRFLDIFNHRLLSMYYRAWRQAQPVAGRDRAGEDRFRVYLGALAGLRSDSDPPERSARSGPALWSEARVPSFAADVLLGHASAYARPGRSADSLATLLSGLVGARVEVRNFDAAWVPLSASDSTRLGSGPPDVPLGRGLPLGRRVLDAQHTFGIRIGPLDVDRHRELWPDAPAMRDLAGAIRAFTNDEWSTRVRLVIARSQVPRWRLGDGDGGRRAALGWSAWLGVPRRERDPDDTSFDLAAVFRHADSRVTRRGPVARTTCEEQADVGIDQR